MKFGTFYLLPQNNQQKNNIEQLICNLTITQWRSGKTVLIACEDKSQAEKIDELLWIFDKNTFVPHDLLKKNIHYTPIVIYWPQCYYKNVSKNVLINLMKKNMNFFFNFHEIIDFIPISETLKKFARNRYKSYKNIGFQLNIEKYPANFMSN